MFGFGCCSWPFTVRTTPPGLPRTICTADFSVQVIELPAETTPMYSCDPSLALVIEIQQSSAAVTFITS